MIRISITDFGDIIVDLREDTPISERLLKHCPFISKATIWKEEIYFETPIEISPNKLVLRVRPGDVTYWPPGRALCLFYGITQPYSPVSPLGEIIGPLYSLREIEDGAEIKVLKYREDKFLDIINELRMAGFKAAIREGAEATSIVTTTYVKGVRVGLELYPEEYGIAIESDALFPYDQSINTRRFIFKAVKAVENLLPEARVDVNEDNYICISGFAKEASEVRNVALQIAKAYVLLWTLAIEVT